MQSFTPYAKIDVHTLFNNPGVDKGIEAIIGYLKYILEILS